MGITKVQVLEPRILEVNPDLQRSSTPWFCCCWINCQASPAGSFQNGNVKNESYHGPNMLEDSTSFKETYNRKVDSKAGNSLLLLLRLPLLLGVVVGLIPVRGLLGKPTTATFTWLHYRTAISAIVTGSLLVHTIFIFHNFLSKMTSSKNSAGNLILTFSGVWFYSAGTLVYTFFLLKSKRLCKYFDTWLKTSMEASDYLVPDKRGRKDINLITIFVFLDCLGENILYHFHAMNEEQRSRLGSLSVSEFLHDYYNSNQYIFPFFDYSTFITLALLITNKLATYAWNFGDIILILISRALYGRYFSLNSYLKNQMETDGCISMIRRGRVSWGKLRKTFFLITELLQEGNKLFAPLIWLSYTTDIFFVCRQLYEGLSPRPSQEKLIDKLYVSWSLLHLIVRTLGVNSMGAAISEEAHRMSKILQHVHPDEYDHDVRRLQRYLGSRVIGITGSGCFIITRSFVLMIISAIFTLEVVLLQNAHLTVG